MSKYFYLTTPIFYPNDRLHIGHAYTMVLADVIVRYKKSWGYQVYFQTGSDEHGEKIAKKAFSLNLTSQELVDKNVVLFQQLWKKLGISEHHFYRTSSLAHKEKVQKIFTKLLATDDIYLASYKGNYCISCEDYISGGKIQDNLCPFCHSALRTIEESAYFLRVSKYYSWLRDYYTQNPQFLLPVNIKKELIENFLTNDMRDLCVTRRDIKWGVLVPNNNEMVIYVWFEALLNYLASAEGEKYFFSVERNCEIIQIIGKDIARFHGIYWPIILKLVQARLPNQILAHGWILSRGDKMSKSKGNVIDPLNLLDKYPNDLLRTYFIAKVNFLQDGILEEGLLKEFYQDFFVNNLSNLVSRINKMLFLYRQGIIPSLNEKTNNQKLQGYYQYCSQVVKEFKEKMDNYELTNAFSQIINLISQSNKLITDLTPWELTTNGNKILLDSTLNYLVNGIKIISFLLNSIIPETSQKIFSVFNISPAKLTWDNCLDFDTLIGIRVNLLEKHLYERLK